MYFSPVELCLPDSLGARRSDGHRPFPRLTGQISHQEPACTLEGCLSLKACLGIALVLLIGRTWTQGCLNLSSLLVRPAPGSSAPPVVNPGEDLKGCLTAWGVPETCLL